MYRLTVFFLASFSFSSLGMAAGKRKILFSQALKPHGAGTVEAWIPAPIENTAFQTVVSREFQGNATVIRLGSAKTGDANFVYAKWVNVEKPELIVTNVIETEDRTQPLSESSGMVFYTQPTAHVQTDGIVSETARKIIGKIKDPDQKARAIYDWIIERASRDPDTRGCGLGDVKTTLTVGNLRGKCADINSLFVGLARASGIPAREVFGQRVAASNLSPSLGKEGDNSKAQHCRAEYYSKNKKGWIPVDPADVRKVILEENLEFSNPRIKQISDSLFGRWDGNWIAFNHARDFVLEGYAADPINYFMYPLIRSGSLHPDGIDPTEAGYQYTSRVVSN